MKDLFFEFANLQGMYNKHNVGSGEKIMKDIMLASNRGHDQDFKDKVEKWISGTFKDSSWLMKYFGQSIRSSIPQVAVIGKMAMDMFNNVSTKFQNATKDHMPILSKLAKKLSDIIDESGSHLLHHVDTKLLKEEYSKTVTPIIENNIFGEELTEKEREEVKRNQIFGIE